MKLPESNFGIECVPFPLIIARAMIALKDF
jgi:hypothetical protein